MKDWKFKVIEDWSDYDLCWMYNNKEERKELSKESKSLYKNYVKKAKNANWMIDDVIAGETYFIIPEGTTIEFFEDNGDGYRGKFMINGDKKWLIEMEYGWIDYDGFSDYLKNMD